MDVEVLTTGSRSQIQTTAAATHEGRTFSTLRALEVSNFLE